MNLRKHEKIRYFHLVPKTEFYQLKLPRNCDVLEVFFGLKDKLGELEPKKNIALKIYEQICPIYGKGPYPMKKKQNCLQNILKLYDDYQNVTRDIKIIEVTIEIQKFQNLKNNYNSYVIFLQKICLK